MKSSMTPVEVAKAYAEAILKMARENLSYKEWSHTLKNVAAFVQNEEVGAILQDPEISKDEVMGLVANLMKQAKASPAERKLILGIAKRGRLALAPLIAEHYEEMSRKAQGIRTVFVASAQKLTLKDEIVLKRLLRERFKIKAELKKQVDPDLLDGFVLRFDGKIVDQSLKGYRERAARVSR